MVIRGVTAMACRLNAMGDEECKRLLRATHDSGEVRNPGCRRQSVRTSARRMVRGSPSVAACEDQWPGVNATRRPAFAFLEGELRAQPVESQHKFASSESDLSVRARKVQPSEPMWPPPQCVTDRFAGKQVGVPPFPLRALGLGRDELKVLRGEDDESDWWARRSIRNGSRAVRFEVLRSAAGPV